MLDEGALIVPEWPAPRGVRALQTTRIGGVSEAPYAALNLGDHVGDDPRAVAENRTRLRAFLPQSPCWLTQEHGARVVDLDREPERTADAAVSRVLRRVCAILTADCLPVLFCEASGSVVAAAHAGWRGLLAGVLENTAVAMKVLPETIRVWLGPMIGPEAFEVGEEVRAAFLRRDPVAEAAFTPCCSGKYLADLGALARQRLAAVGVTAVFGGEMCAYRESERFFSFRRDGRTGRMASLIWLDRADGRGSGADDVL